MLKPLLLFAMGTTLVAGLMRLDDFIDPPPVRTIERLNIPKGQGMGGAAPLMYMDEYFRQDRANRSKYSLVLTLAGLSWLLAGAIWVGRLIPVPEDLSPTDVKPPPGAEELTPAQAAELLGVPLDAPPPVIEEALQTQLAARDLSQLNGLDLESRKYVLQQCELMRKARQVLLDR